MDALLPCAVCGDAVKPERTQLGYQFGFKICCDGCFDAEQDINGNYRTSCIIAEGLTEDDAATEWNLQTADKMEGA